jgi:predicted nucleotidyltransferase
VGDELIAELKARLDAHPDVVVAYLLGSAARGELRPGSDLDVAVLLPARTPQGKVVTDRDPLTLSSLRLSLQADLQEAAHRPVDLVILNQASPDLIHRVLRDGVLLVERDRSARIRFEVGARNEYFDVLPFLKRYREAALR